MYTEFHRSETVTVEHANLLPGGVVTARVLMSLAAKLQKLEYWHKHNGGGNHKEVPFVRHLQGEGGKVTALVQSGALTLKMALRGDEWIVLGDALRVSD